mmetsp:Transcript_120206/g.221091  ORF Transcript_120206/g.221091 Transcript_120206/m.221091 type:complete len:157 (-) Transcript_120206:172-642(-)
MNTSLAVRTICFWLAYLTCKAQGRRVHPEKVDEQAEASSPLKVLAALLVDGAPAACWQIPGHYCRPSNGGIRFYSKGRSLACGPVACEVQKDGQPETKVPEAEKDSDNLPKEEVLWGEGDNGAAFPVVRFVVLAVILPLIFTAGAFTYINQDLIPK